MAAKIKTIVEARKDWQDLKERVAVRITLIIEAQKHGQGLEGQDLRTIQETSLHLDQPNLSCHFNP